MSRSTGSAKWCTKVVVSGLLAGGSLALGAGTAVASPDPLAPVTYTDSTQRLDLTVPAGACSLTFLAVGAQGGTVGSGPAGGAGGRVQASVRVTPGEHYHLLVGGQGGGSAPPAVVRNGRTAGQVRVRPDSFIPATGGVSGGLPSGGAAGQGTVGSGGGGGASAVVLADATAPWLIAAGGGGATGDDSLGGVIGGAGGAAGAGGSAGSGAVGLDGLPVTPADPALDGQGGSGATGAHTGAGGAAGTGGVAGSPGALAVGGAGGGGSFVSSSGTGGGGGGGAFGGGGGGGAFRTNSTLQEAAGGGGGGGSNLAPVGATVNGVTSQTGGGSITVTPHATCPPGVVQSVTATAGNTTARVTWTAPADTGGTPVTGYRITVYVRGVAIRTVASPGAGLTTTVSGLTNGTHYTFEVTAVNSAGTGAVSGQSNVATPTGPPAPPAPPAPPVAPFVLQSQTLWGHVEIAAHSTRFTFEVTFNQARPSLRVTLTSKRTGKLLAATTIHPAKPGRRFTGVIAFPTNHIGNWGAYTWTLTTGAPARQFRFDADVRQHSTLALKATRAHGAVTVTGSAKVLNARSNTYRGWAHRLVDVQRRTADGWVTIATATTDRAGHLRTVLHLARGTILRLLDADTATQFGRASNVRRV